MSNTIKLETWAGQSDFEYSGSVADGVRITIGATKQVSNVTALQFQLLLRHFSGKIVKVGASKSSTSEAGTLDEWLKVNVPGRTIATYVAAILKHEKLASETHGHIRFHS